MEPELKEKFDLNPVPFSLQDKMEVSLAMSFHGSVADTKHFGPCLNHRKDVEFGKQFRTYVLKNNTHLIDKPLLKKTEILDILTYDAAATSLRFKI